MKNNIPNIITGCNLICGCIAIIYALMAEFQMALMFIVIGAAFDFCDGLVARALGVSSPIGKELDSLADCITFGLAPSSFIYTFLTVCDYPGCMQAVCGYVPFAAFLLAAFSALRLAKFNLDTRQTTSFIGLPTPANAVFWASLLTAFDQWFYDMPYGFAVILGMMLISCYLLICEMPMFAMKFKSWGLTEGDNMLKYGFLAFSAVLLITSLVVGNVIGGMALVVLAYVLVSFIIWITK